MAPTANVPQRRGTSARYMDDKIYTEPPDPLEPWSTQGIKNMNVILAWKESDQESF